jgi:hypothetical protein
MRKIYFVIALLLPISLFSQPVYQHYLDTTVTWFEYSGGSFGNSSMQQYTRNHVIGEDSFAGERWYLMHQDWVTTYQTWPNQPTTTTGQSANPGNYRIREDSLGNIWTLDPNGQANLLYEFRTGMTVGDTMWMYDRNLFCEIGLIDTVYLGIEPRARYWCDCSTPFDPRYIVEGIGYNLAFNSWVYPVCQPTWDAHYRQVCYQKQGDILVLDTSFVCGTPAHFPPVGVADPMEAGLSVRWSAVNQELVLHSEELLEGFQWAIHDLNGRVLMEEDGFRERILLPELARGMYVFVGRSDGGRKVLRFLVE